jgi:hypothetical protein
MAWSGPFPVWVDFLPLPELPGIPVGQGGGGRRISRWEEVSVDVRSPSLNLSIVIAAFHDQLAASGAGTAPVES